MSLSLYKLRQFIFMHVPQEESTKKLYTTTKQLHQQDTKSMHRLEHKIWP